MASNLRVDSIVPATGSSVSIGTATGGVNIPGVLTYEDVTNVDSVGVITARDGLRVTGIATISGDVSIADKIIHTGDTNTAIRFPAADTITAETGGSERLRIDSSGRLLLGTTTEGFATYGEKFTIADSGHCGMTIRSGTSNYGTIYFSDGDDGSADEVRGFMDYNHSTNQLQLGSNGSARLKIDTNGHITQPNLPSFMAYGNASYTTISSGGNLQPYVFPNTAHNTGTHYNTTSGKFTAPVTGVYQLNWNLFCKSDTNQTSAATLEFYVVKNGSTVSRLHNKKGYGNMGDDQQIINLHVFEKLNANDEISINAYAYNVDWKIYGAHSTFSGALIG